MIGLKLLILNPFYVKIWIKLANTFKKLFEINHQSDYYYFFQLCFYNINELNKHGYINRSEVVHKQKSIYQEWVC